MPGEVGSRRPQAEPLCHAGQAGSPRGTRGRMVAKLEEKLAAVWLPQGSCTGPGQASPRPRTAWHGGSSLAMGKGRQDEGM